jgi:hypothetical protein
VLFKALLVTVMGALGYITPVELMTPAMMLFAPVFRTAVVLNVAPVSSVSWMTPFTENPARVMVMAGSTLKKLALTTV